MNAGRRVFVRVGYVWCWRALFELFLMDKLWGDFYMSGVRVVTAVSLQSAFHPLSLFGLKLDLPYICSVPAFYFVRIGSVSVSGG